MDNGLIVGLGGVIIAVLSYFAGVARTEQRHKSDDRNSRITGVVDKYVALAQAGRTNGFHGLLNAGVGNLKNDEEIRDALDGIRNHGQNWDPRAKLQGIDTYKFFQIVIERNLGGALLNGLTVDKLIDEMKGGA